MEVLSIEALAGRSFSAMSIVRFVAVVVM